MPISARQAFSEPSLGGVPVLSGLGLHKRPLSGRQSLLGEAAFYGVSFDGDADFLSAIFKTPAVFPSATFSGQADFSFLSLGQGADFSGARFVGEANFAHITAIGVVDFRGALFDQPTQARFFQVNKEKAVGLRVRLLNCDMGKAEFQDVNWHRERGRMVLQDELDIRAGQSPDCELVAIAYRRLVNNFEKARAYDLAEDCFIGAMEMKRLDSTQPWLSRVVLTLYRWASNYGSSYHRAFGMLIGLLIAFGVVFALVWLEPLSGGSSPRPITWNDVWRACKDGLFHSLEVATFQRQTLYANPNPFDRLIAMLENVLVPAQLALLLLALRRRFRR